MGKIFDLNFMFSVVPGILAYLPVTLSLTFIASLIGVVIGFGVALVRFFRIPYAQFFCKFYISFVRGTPTLVQLLLVYYGLPIFLNGINAKFGTNFSVNSVPKLVFASIALSVNAGAYMSEIIRSAINSVDAGQIEACYSVNMTAAQAMRRIILPQAFAVALPPLGNSVISMLKETSLVFNIAVVEIMAESKLIASRSFRFFEVYIVVSVIYWVCCMALERVLARTEESLRHYERNPA
ncbi:MAG: amino acid ABC transporter permease [Synergistaceae bacterium]|jgi:His/Glu/Gln/Arg/opine family amino acid ABC transporter permease subunit|nr:amino acid ABC transporter permease [Synergistaceae bacterium]